MRPNRRCSGGAWAGATVERGLPARRPLPGHRTAGPAAHRRARRPPGRAGGRAAGGRCAAASAGCSTWRWTRSSRQRAASTGATPKPARAATARRWRAAGSQGNRLAEVQVIFRQMPKVASQLHCGSRLVFARDGRLFVALGDRFSRKEDAQKLDNHLGKVVRIEADGQVPADNPFVGTRRRQARDLEPGPPQHAGRRAAPRHRRAVGHRARAAGRRRTQPRARPGATTAGRC